MKRWGLVAAAAALCVSPLEGRVYQRRPSDPTGLFDAATPGWTPGGSFRMKVNGRPVEARVAAADRDASAVLHRLERRLARDGRPVTFLGRGDLAWGVAAGEPALRFLVLSPPALNRAIVFLLTDAAPGPRAARTAAGAPRPAGAELLSETAVRESGTVLRVYRRGGDRGEILRGLRRDLEGRGWADALPARGGGGGGGLLCYLKGREACFVSVKSAGAGGGNLICVYTKAWSGPFGTGPAAGGGTR
jgi:hypothetical protein